MTSKSIEKFGVQTEKAKVIFVFRNGDKHHKGAKITLRARVTFDQLLQDLSSQVGVPTGAVRQIFTADGKPIKTIPEFEDRGKYVCAGAEKFNKELLPSGITAEEKPQTSQSSSQSTPSTQPTTAPKTTTVKKTPAKPIEKFGTQIEKAKIIYCFRNADKHHSGTKVTVSGTKFKTLEQLKEHLSKELKLPTGAVRQIYTVEGTVIRSLQELEDTKNYVCGAAEKFSKSLMSPAALVPQSKKDPKQAPDSKEVSRTASTEEPKSKAVSNNTEANTEGASTE